MPRKIKPARDYRYGRQADPRRNFYTGEVLRRLAELVGVTDPERKNRFAAALKRAAREYDFMKASRTRDPTFAQVLAALDVLQKHCEPLAQVLETLDEKTETILICGANRLPRQPDDPGVPFVGEDRYINAKTHILRFREYLRETKRTVGKPQKGRPQRPLERRLFARDMAGIWSDFTGKAPKRAVRSDNHEEVGAVTKFARAALEVIDHEAVKGLDHDIREAVEMAKKAPKMGGFIPYDR